MKSKLLYFVIIASVMSKMSSSDLSEKNRADFLKQFQPGKKKTVILKKTPSVHDPMIKAELERINGAEAAAVAEKKAANEKMVNSLMDSPAIKAAAATAEAAATAARKAAAAQQAATAEAAAKAKLGFFSRVKSNINSATARIKSFFKRS